MFEYRVENLLIEAGHPLITQSRIVHVMQVANTQGANVLQIMALTEREVKNKAVIIDEVLET